MGKVNVAVTKAGQKLEKMSREGLDSLDERGRKMMQEGKQLSLEKEAAPASYEGHMRPT
jgi:hypothetical protein